MRTTRRRKIVAAAWFESASRQSAFPHSATRAIRHQIASTWHGFPQPPGCGDGESRTNAASGGGDCSHEGSIVSVRREQPPPYDSRTEYIGTGRPTQVGGHVSIDYQVIRRIITPVSCGVSAWRNQMLRFGVRQSWVQQWTGCSERRIRSICCAAPEPIAVSKRRGPVPARAFRIISTALLRSEASAIVGLAQRLGVLPVGPVKSAGKSLPGLALGERLCWLYELYREWVPDATLTMEQFLLLVLELAEQKTLFLSHCDTCGGFLVIDKLETRHRECAACALAGRSPQVQICCRNPRRSGAQIPSSNPCSSEARRGSLREIEAGPL